jgi:hypothetical protein
MDQARLSLGIRGLAVALVIAGCTRSGSDDFAAIRYEAREYPRGGEVRITSGDSVAVRAIHVFLASLKGVLGRHWLTICIVRNRSEIAGEMAARSHSR